MRRMLVMTAGGILLALAGICGYVSAGPEPSGIYQLFYDGNAHYAEGDYALALQNYHKLLAAGFESGNLYYNLGNAFCKLGQYGQAVLAYEKGRRLIPHDSDLRSNMMYVRTLLGNPPLLGDHDTMVVRALKAPFTTWRLSSLIAFTLVLYVVVLLVAAFCVAFPGFARRLYLPGAAILAVSIVVAFAAGVRYYDEVVLRHGIVIQKEVDAKYEPIDRSKIFYKLQEGQEVIITGSDADWRRVRRFDDKAGWIPKEAVGEV